MSLGRRNVRAADSSAWIFNRMADVYDARPAYPEEVLAELAGLAGSAGNTVVDLGAGIGHLAVPLARRGYRVIAVEPARAMLDRLEERAQEQGVVLEARHGTAETLELSEDKAHLVLIADALHFLHRHRAANAMARALRPDGSLAVLTVTPAETPFMIALREAMEVTSPRRPRPVQDAVRQLAGVCKVRLASPRRFVDETPMSDEHLERMLRSISFIGPALNAQRWAAFQRLLEALPRPRVWSRVVTLHAGRRGPKGSR